MAFLGKKIQDDVHKELAALTRTVHFKYFGQEMECRFCKETRELLEEVAALSDRIHLEVFDFIKDKETVDRLGIERIPALAVSADEDYGIRFYGIPSGYEFTSLIEAIKLVGTGKTLISDEARKFLETLEHDVHLQVFVTPTCPYCTGSVILAHQLAFASPRIRADMIEATEFPQLAQKYDVMGVPRTVINETGFIEGAGSEPMVLAKIKEVLGTD